MLVRIGRKLNQLALKCNKSETFSMSVLVHFGSPAQSPRIVPLGCSLVQSVPNSSTRDWKLPVLYLTMFYIIYLTPPSRQVHTSKPKVWGNSTSFGPKVGLIGPKWDKSGPFSDQIWVYFGALWQNVLKSDLKKSRICPIWGQSDPLWSQTWHLLLVLSGELAQVLQIES